MKEGPWPLAESGLAATFGRSYSEGMNELLVGYARVSTEEQDLTAQRNALAALGDGADRIYADQGGHALMHERPELLVALVSDWLDRTRPDNN